MIMIPSELPKVNRAVEVDTETSGLFPDSGARISTVSVAWHDDAGTRHSYAFPFNQGLHGKPEWLAKVNWGWYEYEKVTVFKNGNERRTKKRRRIGQDCGAKHEPTGCDCGYAEDEVERALGPNPNLPESEWEALLEWLIEHDLVWHNALFDLIMFWGGAPFPGWRTVDLLPNTCWDTMLGQRILDPEHRMSLKLTGQRRFGIEPEEKDALEEHLRSRGLPTKRYDLASWDVMEVYAAQDTSLTARLARDQWYRVYSGESTWRRCRYEMQEVMGVLVRMEQRGVAYRHQESLAWAQKLEAEAEELARDLPFDLTPAGLRTFFFTVELTSKGKSGLGLDPIKKTDSGLASTDAETMDRLAERDVPYARQYRQYKLLTDSVLRYYRGYAEAVGPDGRLRTRFRQTGTRSGRLSCERINLQAIPHDHRLLASGSKMLAQAPSPRSLIYAPDGYALYHMDLAQAELRVAALYAQCLKMLEIIREGRDPHGETAIELGLSEPDRPNWKQMRTVGKRGNFSLIFGVGAVTFQKDLRSQVGIDLGAAKTRKIVSDWRALYPEFGKKIESEMQLANQRGWSEIRGPVRRWYSEMELHCHSCKKSPCRCNQFANDTHKAFNQQVQGNLGEFGKQWMVRSNRHLVDAGLDDLREGLLLQIHDALLVMVPDNAEGERLAHDCADIARSMWAQWFPGVPGDVDVSLWSNA